MVFQPVSTDNSNASNLNQVNELGRTVKGMERTQIFKDDAGTRRVLLGKGANDFYGLKVSPAGTDVYDAADGDLIFNSDQNIFKIVGSGTVDVVVPGSPNATYTTVISHGLDYIPAVVAYLTNGISGSTIYQPIPTIGYANTGSENPMAFQSIFTYWIDATDLTFAIATSLTALSGTYTFKYYLLQETAN